MLPAQDQRLTSRVRTHGLWLAPALGIAAWWLAPSNMNPLAARLFALLISVLMLWLTAALPVAVTALLAPALLAVLGIVPTERAFLAFGHPVLIMVLAAQLLAMAAERSRLDRALAVRLLPRRGQNAELSLLSTTIATMLMAGWLARTATTAMMVPVVRATVDRLGPRAQAAGLMGISFATALGAMLTPIGSAANLLAIAILASHGHRDLPLLLWTLLALPLVFVVLALWTLICMAILRKERKFQPASVFLTRGLTPPPTALNLADLETPAALDRGQWGTLGILAVAAIGWMLPGALDLLIGPQARLTLTVHRHGGAAVTAALAMAGLFMLPAAPKLLTNKRIQQPILTWPQAAQVDWSTVLLLGGALSLADQAFATGLSAWLGEFVLKITFIHSGLALVWLFALATVLLAQWVPATAVAALLCPLAVMSAQQLGLSPVAPCVVVGLLASMGLTLPLSKPSNAVVFSTGLVSRTTLMRLALPLDISAAVLGAPCVWWATRALGL